jgi:branched-chain amino acid transport system substrate-binding protein
MKNVKQILLFLTIVTGLIITGCNFSGGKNEIFNVGVIAPLTGEGARYGEAMRDGIDLAINEINRNGGYDKDSVVAIYMDDKFDVKEGLNGLNYLVDYKKVPVIFGPAGSGISKALMPVANEKKVVLFSSISTSDGLAGEGDYFFRNISPNSMQAASVAEFLTNKLSVKNVGVFYENNEYGINMNKIFKDKFTAGAITFNLPYEFKQADFRNSILSIKDKKFDAIFIQGTTWGIANLIKQLRQYNIDCPIITGDGGYGDEIKTIAGNSANGLFCTLPAVKDTTSSSYTSFKKSFVNKYKKEPDVYSVYSYDAVMMVFDSIKKEKKGNITGELIKNKLFATTYTGIGGTYKFDKFGDVDIPYVIFQYSNGEYKRVN